MILSQRHMTLEGQSVISHFTFNPPLTVASELVGDACFIIPMNTEGHLYRVDGSTQVTSNQGVLMKCGTYINKWQALDPARIAEVIILRLPPTLINKFLDDKGLKPKKSAKPPTTAVVRLDLLMRKFVEGLCFYFDNPTLVNDELVTLKIKELTLLLSNMRQANPLSDLLGSLFNPEQFNLREIVDANAFENLSLDELASLANMSTTSFKRKFKSLMGDSPGRYVKHKKLEQAAFLLKTTTKRISTIAYECGFADAGYFAKVFRSEFEMSPAAFRLYVSNAQN